MIPVNPTLPVREGSSITCPWSYTITWKWEQLLIQEVVSGCKRSTGTGSLCFFSLFFFFRSVSFIVFFLVLSTSRSSCRIFFLKWRTVVQEAVSPAPSAHNTWTDCLCVCWDADLHWCVWAGQRSQSPDNIESGKRTGGEEGARQDHKIPPNHLQIGLPHGHSECDWTTNTHFRTIFKTLASLVSMLTCRQYSTPSPSSFITEIMIPPPLLLCACGCVGIQDAY